MPKTFAKLVKDHPRLLTTGFFLVFFSAFGQSVFIGFYIPLVQDDYGLSHTATGSLYAAATIASALAITLTGKGLDKIPLRRFLTLALSGLALGCFVMAAGRSALVLGLAFFLLRHFGQGLMTLTAQTAINRYLYEDRGKGVALAKFGGAAHIMVFPILAVIIADILPWRTAWMAYGIFIMLGLLPFFRYLLRNHETTTHAAWKKDLQTKSEKTLSALADQWTRTHVLKDWRFYALVAIILTPPFAGTAVFFFQRDLAASLGVSAAVFAGTFPVFTVFSVICALISGAVIDRINEKPVLLTFPVIYALGVILLTKGGSLFAVYAGMGLIGGGGGMMGTTAGPLLAHMYGTKHLGSIKSLISSAAILSSALSPFIFGVFIDMGYDIADTLFWVAGYSAFIGLLAIPIFKTIDTD